MNARPALFDARVRRSIEDEIERLISLLDLVDGDPDLENGHDAEPEETDCDLAGAHSDLEGDDGETDGSGFIWGGGEERLGHSGA